MLIRSDTMIIAPIANWISGCESATKTACFTYRIFFNLIRTPILNWRYTVWRLNWARTEVSGAVRVFDVIKPVATV